jgi:Fur family transcriptional regulator, ferric uptake regulator
MNYDAMLLKKKLKRTFPRIKVLEILDSSEHFMSAEEISHAFKDDAHRLPLSTIYRVLESLVRHDLVHELNLDHRNIKLYEIAHKHHAHHLICVECDKVIHLEKCPVHVFEEELKETYGFKMQHHSLDFYGVCEACQKAL